MINSFYSAEELKRLGIKEYGNNIKISRYARIYSPEKIKMGNNVRIDDYSILSGNIVLGSNIHIAAYCGLFAGDYEIVLEDFTTLSSRCAVYALTDDYSGETMTNPTVAKEYKNVTGGRVTIGKHSIIGTGTTIFPNITVGEGVAVGSMSLINKDLEEWGIYYGIPCKKYKDRKKDLLLLEKKYKERR